MSDKPVLLRQWAILEILPSHPLKMAVSVLINNLKHRGFDFSSAAAARRSVQRDLNLLSEYFPITCETQGNTNHWFWPQKKLSIQGMGPDVALALQMAQEHLRETMPQESLGQLSHLFDHANEVLERSNSHLRDWRNKVAILHRTPILQAARVNLQDFALIQNALLHQQQLVIHYKARGARSTKQHRVHPLGLVEKAGVSYLVAFIDGVEDWGDPTPFALHRIHKVEQQDESSYYPDDFSLQDYAHRLFSYPVSSKHIKVKLSFDPPAAKHLEERPIAKDQVLRHREDETVITATVEDTLELRWWLMGFGDSVEVLAPKKLRQEFADVAENLYGYYHE